MLRYISVFIFIYSKWIEYYKYNLRCDIKNNKSTNYYIET